MRPLLPFLFVSGGFMYQTVKGTYDILPDQFEKRRRLKSAFKYTVESYGYRLMETPIFEYAGVFKKENDTSDMVTKEMYTFSPNGKDELTLRPEGTAGIVRSLIQNKLYASSEPVKLAYMGEMFRHERPQKGRQRQFTQLGIENIGEKSPLIDAEVIALAYSFIDFCGLENLKVLINTLGDSESRIAYSRALKEYFEQYRNELCFDCQNRLDKNPLRILDCKIDRESDIVKNAPKMHDYLSESSKAYFEEVKKYLDSVNIPYEIDDSLVRGLDYYTDTVFELVSTNENAGSQATVLAGGRYDELVSQMGGPAMSGIGFACGLERLCLMADEENKEETDYSLPCDFYIIDMARGSELSFKTARKLRDELFNVELNYYERSMKSQFKSAERHKARYIIIIGEDEVKDNRLTIKDTVNRSQISVNYDELDKFLEGLGE